MTPVRPCRVVGCPNLQPCPQHPARPAWGSSHATAKRTRGRQLQAARERLYISKPYCQECRRVLTFSGMVRDHIIPLAEGGQDIESNTQPLCRACSDAKTQREAKRGMERAAHGG